MILWVGGLIAPLIAAAGLIVWGALLLNTGRGHARATGFITRGIGGFAATGAFIASLMTLVHGTPIIISILVHALSAATLSCVVLRPRLLSADLISYLEETTVLHLLRRTRRAGKLNNDSSNQRIIDQ